MAYRYSAKKAKRTLLAPTAPRKRFYATKEETLGSFSEDNYIETKYHPLTDLSKNKLLASYESDIKGRFDRIVPLLKKISELDYGYEFVDKCRLLAKEELGIKLPEWILDKAWIDGIDMRKLFAWCVFQTHQNFSNEFFCADPLDGAKGTKAANEFESLLFNCGFHLLDITPCSDGRLAHTVAYALRIPFSSVRRRSHAGALFDVEKTVNRWVKTEHRRYREGLPNTSELPTRYLKVVTYHFSSVDPSHQGCAAHGSDDSVAASAGRQRLMDFRESVENSFCCGASVDLLLIGIDTDTDSIRVHLPDKDSQISLDKSISSLDIYKETQLMTKDKARKRIFDIIIQNSSGNIDRGMALFTSEIISNNISQIDYVRELYNGAYKDAGHAERFIGVGIGFKEVHLRNLTYFSHLDTVEKGAPDLDVGIKIFTGLNVAKGLPIPIVIRFDYSGKVPGARERAIEDCKRVDKAIAFRYRNLVADGLLHTLLTIRDRDRKEPAETVGSSLDPSLKEAH